MDDIKVSKVRTGLLAPEIKSKGSLLNGDDSYAWLMKREGLIGWTYSFNPYAIVLLHFAKLISCQGRAQKNVKIASNTHLKCYIHKYQMLIGSFNLTYPTIEDLSVLVTDKILINHMHNQFTQHWKRL